VGIPDRETYLRVARRGRGTPLPRERRGPVFDLFEAYQAYLSREGLPDWADIPLYVLEAMDAGNVPMGIYDAILIDEAQDFAPVWIRVIKRLLKPESGYLFMADDPSQSIYRFFSWREKGVPVVGRTRWLRVPYRNSLEIFQAAYALIQDDPALLKSIEAQIGMHIEPDLANEMLRRGPRPEVREFTSIDKEAEFLRGEIQMLLQEGVDAERIAVLHRRHSGVRRLRERLKGLDVRVNTYHAFKGLEFDTVFVTQVQEGFSSNGILSEEQLSEERRLFYMAMTRARERLYLSCKGRWPRVLEPLLDYADRAVRA